MKYIKIGVMKEKVTYIIWKNEPFTSKELIKVCETQLNLKNITSYTV